ncbi:MAG: hypothetical protein FWF55_07060 [Treponema sp.]|nr:hypothetical protein [Treponema sp.]
MVFDTMNEALKHFGLGELTNMYDTFHAYGITDERKHVWLPIISPTDNHINKISEKCICKRRDLILERNISGSNTVKKPDMITSHVITREKIADKDKYDYDYIGEYKQVLFDEDLRFTVHIKVPSVKADGKILYDPAYTKTANKARQKIKKLWKKMNKEQ